MSAVFKESTLELTQREEGEGGGGGDWNKPDPLFEQRKQQLLESFVSDLPDKSPKGMVDTPLVPLLNLLNEHADYVSTSSCSGRIVIYADPLPSAEVPKGKKKKGGKFINVSHEPLPEGPDWLAGLFKDLETAFIEAPWPALEDPKSSGLVYFKFEPMASLFLLLLLIARRWDRFCMFSAGQSLLHRDWSKLPYMPGLETRDLPWPPAVTE